MKSTSTRNNSTVYEAHLTAEEISLVLCQALAAKHGVTLPPEGLNTRGAPVFYRGYYSSHGSGMRPAHGWQVEITIDHSKEADHETRT